VSGSIDREELKRQLKDFIKLRVSMDEQELLGYADVVGVLLAGEVPISIDLRTLDFRLQQMLGGRDPYWFDRRYWAAGAPRFSAPNIPRHELLRPDSLDAKIMVFILCANLLTPLEIFLNHLWGMTVFATKAGRWGVADAYVAAGDRICLVAGAESPMVLRHRSSPRDTSLLMGVAFVAGKMNVSEWVNEMGTVRNFVIT
jgi:hypothetical protein